MATTCEINGQKAKIEYPCSWEYKIILPKDENAEDIVKEMFLQKEFGLKFSHKSKSGSYRSYNLSTLVNSDDEREEIFSQLKKHSKIKYVL